MGLVCFRLKGHDPLSKQLLAEINSSGKVHMVPASVHGRFVIRFCVCAQDAQDSDVDFAWHVISYFADQLVPFQQDKGVNVIQNCTYHETPSNSVFKPKTILVKKPSRNQFSFVDTIEYTGIQQDFAANSLTS